MGSIRGPSNSPQKETNRTMIRQRPTICVDLVDEHPRMGEDSSRESSSGPLLRPESWELTLHSADSSLTASQLSILTTASSESNYTGTNVFLPATHPKSTAATREALETTTTTTKGVPLPLHPPKKTGSISSDISTTAESLFEGERAGILGGRLGHELEQTLKMSQGVSVDYLMTTSTNLSNTQSSSSRRRSSLTDPGRREGGGEMNESAGTGLDGDKIERRGRSYQYDQDVEDDLSASHGKSLSGYGTAVDEEHVNFVLMYDMLTGIRHSVSVCQAKPSRPLVDQDFRYVRTYNFLQDSSDTTPSKYEFRFKDYCPWVFRSLREAFKIDAADYLVSLTGKYALSEIGSPGKSGSFFYFSQDFRYIIKTIRQSEHTFLRKILRQYYEHVRRNGNSLIVRFYGLHRVRMSNIRKIYFVVMGNIFPPHRDIHETYDLKGSTLGRYIAPEEMILKPMATLKDLNWIQRKRKLKLGPEKATLLMNQLRADCQFLAKVRIMDYSLLIGIHSLSRGNREGIRERSMMMYEPATPLVGTNTLSFKPSAVSAAAIGDSTGIPNERKMCIFYSEDGGFRSSHKDGTCADEIYYLGIIDILTPYSVTKKIEHVFKSLQHDRSTISAVNPVNYSRRFLKFMAENILQDTKADYASKDLPEIPAAYTYREEVDGTMVVVVVEGEREGERGEQNTQEEIERRPSPSPDHRHYASDEKDIAGYPYAPDQNDDWKPSVPPIHTDRSSDEESSSSPHPPPNHRKTQLPSFNKQ